MKTSQYGRPMTSSLRSCPATASAAYAVRVIENALVSVGAGAQRVYFAYAVDGPSIGSGLTTAAGATKPLYRALEVALPLASGATVIASPDQTGRAVYVAVFTTADQVLVVATNEDGGVDLYVSTQWIHNDLRQIAPCLGLAEDQVHMTLAGVGGAFGGREDLSMQIHAGMLALHTGRPVKMSYNRYESFFGHVHRHPAQMRYEFGATADGRLLYADVEIVLDGGAYTSSTMNVTGNAASLGVVLLVGMVAGAWFLSRATDRQLARTIGWVLVALLCVQLAGKLYGRAGTAGPGRRLDAPVFGALAGFTSMVANAGGPVMSMYLLSAGFRKLGFLGTSAFFFLIVNTSKLPFSAGLGLIDADSLLLDAALVLFVVPGALLGRWAVDRINQRLFERLVIAATVVGGVQLLVP